METVEASFHDGEWESLCGIFNFETELERFTAPEILGQCSSPIEGSSDPSDPSSIVGVDENLFCSLGNPNSSDTIFAPYHPTLETHDFINGGNELTMNNDASMYMGLAGIAEKHITTNPFVHALPENITQEVACADPTNEIWLKRKFDMTQLYMGNGNEIDMSRNTKKKHRVPRHAEETGKKISKSKKNQKLTTDSNNEKNKTGSDGQSLDSYSSDDENASRETSTVVKLGGKTRASRGTATDPQSLYARKRRERINERLKILQNLVPNGTKVDISTMLEEAVHYVKFLQLQIKLLSSDDLWMFAPLAYSGFDVGLPQKIFSQLLKE